MESNWLQLDIMKLEVKNMSVLGEESLSNRIFLNIFYENKYKLLFSCYFCSFSFLDYLYGLASECPESHLEAHCFVFWVALRWDVSSSFMRRCMAVTSRASCKSYLEVPPNISNPCYVIIIYGEKCLQWYCIHGVIIQTR